MGGEIYFVSCYDNLLQRANKTLNNRQYSLMITYRTFDKDLWVFCELLIYQSIWKLAQKSFHSLKCCMSGRRPTLRTGKSEVVNQYQQHQKKYPMNISKEWGFDDYFFSCWYLKAYGEYYKTFRIIDCWIIIRIRFYLRIWNIYFW